MENLKKIGVGVAVLAVLGAGAYFVQHKRAGSMDGESSKESAGQPATLPEFSLTDLNGKTVTSKDFAGKAVLLNFWATWCPPCREEIPDLIKLQDQYASQNFTVLGVSLDEDGPEGVKKFVAEHKMTYPIVMGNEKMTDDFGGIRGIPTSFVINREGKILDKIVGGRSREEFEKAIKAAL